MQRICYFVYWGAWNNAWCIISTIYELLLLLLVVIVIITIFRARTSVEYL